MQRSRKALQRRRADLQKHVSETKQFYTVSLSVILISWGFFFLLSTFISQGNSFGDGIEELDGGVPINKVGPAQVSISGKLIVPEDNTSDTHVSKNINGQNIETGSTDKGLLFREENSPCQEEHETKDISFSKLKIEEPIANCELSDKEEVLEAVSDSEVKEEKAATQEGEKLHDSAAISSEQEQTSEENSHPKLKEERKNHLEYDKSSGSSTEREDVLDAISDSEVKFEKLPSPKNDQLTRSSPVPPEEEQIIEENPYSRKKEEKSNTPKDDNLRSFVSTPRQKEQVSEEISYSELKAEKRPPVKSYKLPSSALDSGAKEENEAPKNDIFPGSTSGTKKKERGLEEHHDLWSKPEKRPLKNDKLSRVTPSLCEFKSKTLTATEKYGHSLAGSIKNRVEPGGKEYNYASSSKGAKAVAFNKEAKGASNILAKDKDKYLRNPCSAEAKHVIIELSEETLVDTIEIGNFEHYSSNLKDFELLSSLIYPTDSWIKIANFTAVNVKHKQRFAIPEPKWARYLKLNLLTHYGSEFYCTLSVLEVYGVDAVETMLEDLISAQDNHFALEEPTATEPPSLLEATEDDLYSELLSEMYYGPRVKEITNSLPDDPKKIGVDAAWETRPPQVGRMPGDAVLKILMQKVRSLDVNSAVLERYLENLNSRYGKIFKDIDSEIDDKGLVLKKIRAEIQTIQDNQDSFRKDIKDLLTWESMVSSQVDILADNNAVLRSEVEKVRDSQITSENRGLVVMLISFVFGIFAIFNLVVDLLATVFRMQSSEIFCRSSSVWIVLLLSSTIVTIIMML